MSRRFNIAMVYVRQARFFADDLPDGMADELKEAYQCYMEETDRGEEAKEGLADEVEDIFKDYGYPMEEFGSEIG